MDIVSLGDITNGVSAFRPPEIVITLAGDSISQGSAHPSAWARLLEQRISVVFPDSNVKFRNISAPGWGWTQLNSQSFIGGTNYSYPPGATLSPPYPSLWPTGTVTGQSWLDAVKATQPHILILALGINAAQNTTAEMNNIRQVITKTRSWPRVPSVVLMTPAIPSKNQGQQWLNIGQWAQGIADGMREVAKEFNATVIDANAEYRMLLEGVDVNQVNDPVAGISDFSSWVKLNGTTPVQTPNGLSYAGGWGVMTRPVSSSNVDIKANFTLPANGVGVIWYRSDPASPGDAYLAFMETHFPRISLLYKSAPNHTYVQTVNVTPAASYEVRVEAIGARHKIWVNGALVIDLAHYGRLFPGRYGLEATGGTVTDIVAGHGFKSVQLQTYTEEELLGVAGGGNSINHPTTLGHEKIYYEPAASFLDDLKAAVDAD